jgi:hypothetical protein
MALTISGGIKLSGQIRMGYNASYGAIPKIFPTIWTLCENTTSTW